MKRSTARTASSERLYDVYKNGHTLQPLSSAPISGQTEMSNGSNTTSIFSNHNLPRRRIRRPDTSRRGAFHMPSHVLIMAITLTIFFGVFCSITAYFMFYLESLVTRRRDHRKGHENTVQQQSDEHHSAHSPWQRNMEARKGPPPRHVAVLSVEAPHNSTELIDMRQLSISLPFDNADGGVWKQGFEVQPRPFLNHSSSDDDDVLQIFVVPHSHCDPGWLKTFDEYFQSQTKHIISSVIQALEEDERRTFIWAEISYFAWWWEEQNETTQSSVRRLLQSKQLEFVTGGWVQPDEANSNWDALEIQMQEGYDWITENVGHEFLPKYGWSIDPFGYSPTLPYMLKSQFGLEGILIQRVHYAVKKALAEKKQLEFYWRQTWDEEGQFDMLTHLMPFFSYDVPHTCGPNPAICCQFDFGRAPLGSKGKCPWKLPPVAIRDSNVKERALTLLDQYLKKANLYRGNAVLIPLGDDFRYETLKEAELQYTNYQRLFDYINENVKGVTVQFGTLSQYFEAIRGTFTPPILKGSFFTYSDVNQDYWSGYFTSRAFDKALDRQLERVLYAAKSLGATRLELRVPRRQLSLFQHHDGVTGTAKTKVVKDYAKRMYDAIKTTQAVILQKLQEHNSELAALLRLENNMANDSTIEEAAVSDVSNESSRYSNSSKTIDACWQSDGPRGLSENMCGDLETVFAYNPLLDTVQFCGGVSIEGGHVEKVKLPCEEPGPMTGAKPIFHNVTGMMIWPIQEQWLVWMVNSGGAYLFFPNHTSPYNVENATVQQEGYVVETDFWRRTVIERIVPDEKNAIVFDFIYEINLQQGNQEWFARFSCDILSNGIFHTDLNGFNFDTHHRRSDLPIQSQVFPMPAHAAIQDNRTRLTVLSEHAQGTASLVDGAIDVFLDRRLLQDDQRGLGQGVQDNVATRTRFRIILEHDGFDTNPEAEFQPTPFCRKEWNQLNHPLEFFGRRTIHHLEHHISIETQKPVIVKRPQPHRFGDKRPSIAYRRNGSPLLQQHNPQDEADAQLAENEQLPPGYAAAYGHLISEKKKDPPTRKDTAEAHLLEEKALMEELNAENNVIVQSRYVERVKAFRMARKSDHSRRFV